MATALDAPPLYCSPMASIMLAGEEDEGRKGVWPHHKRVPPWFIPEDWVSWPVLSYSKTELHIVAVHSARKGALRRLIDGAANAGLAPVIVCPLGPAMFAILRKWGWQETIVGEGWDRREEWRPTPPAQKAEGGSTSPGSDQEGRG